MAEQAPVDPAYDPSETRPAWMDAVAAWEWVPLDEQTSRKCGACPRCGHLMTIDAGGGTVASMLPSRRRRVLARCTCAANHEGRPGGVTGCGFRALIPGPP
jgi:hypothetical protein